MYKTQEIFFWTHPVCRYTKQRGEQNSRLCVMTERDYQCKVQCPTGCLKTAPALKGHDFP